VSRCWGGRALALALGAVALGGCGGSHRGAAHPPRVSLAPAALSAALGAPPAGYAFPRGGRLAPGRYATRTNPAVLLRLGRGWEYATRVSESLHRVAAFGRDSEGDDVILFINPEGVYEPRNRPNPRLIPVPSDLAAWLHQNPWLLMSKPVTTRIGGLSARQVTGVARSFPAAEAPQTCVEPCVPLFGPAALIASGYAPFRYDSRDIFDIPQVHGRPLVIWTTAVKHGRRGFLREAERVLRSVKFA
jgi:hypothetical protein